MLSNSPLSFFDSNTEAIVVEEDPSPSLSAGSPCEMSELDLFDGLVTLPDHSHSENNNCTMAVPLKTSQDTGLLGYISEENMEIVSVTVEDRFQKGTHSSREYAPCMSRNAINARENRQKKKEYVKNLENSVNKLKTENLELKSECKSLKETVSNLTSEVEYLKGVLANQSTLATILNKLSDIPGLSFSTSIKPPTEKNNNSVKPPTTQSKRKRCLENQENVSKINNSEVKKRKVTRSSFKLVEPPEEKNDETDLKKDGKTAFHPRKRFLEKFQSYKRWSIEKKSNLMSHLKLL
ncbi:uncharacterized protein LOC133173640 [Saccostrea echinata]|uniref:uncharacterized protein LOC133173640 n=1 Tax=Saccostrea echinata TaxID=191078 RepID=UPI002A81A53C|nr:uncharacterized protein LOC133173640 [Saccostrea echinata]